MLEHVRYDHAICLGDLVDYGPDPLAVIDWIRDNRIPTVRGNHDNAVALHVDCGCGYKYKHLSEATREYTRSQITEKEEQFLASLPLSLDFTFDGLTIRAIHGSPESFFDYIYPDTPPEKVGQWLAGHFLRLSARRPYARAHDHEAAEAHSIEPRQRRPAPDGDWRASCLVFDTATQKLETIRLEYDIDGTCDKIRKSMPHAEELIAILKRGY